MELKDVLHLYLGCEVFYNNRPGILHSVSEDPAITSIATVRFTDSGRDDDYVLLTNIDDIKLALRPLKSILNTEAFHVYVRYFGKTSAPDFTTDTGSAYFNPKNVQVKSFHAIRIFDGDDYETGDFMKVLWLVPYLLSKHFDLFGLIESGQAINKTTL